MNIKHIRAYLMLCSLVVVFQPIQGLAQQNSDAAKAVNQKHEMANTILTPSLANGNIT